MNIVQRLVMRAFGIRPDPTGNQVWVGATVRPGDVAAGRSLGTGPAGAYIGRMTQYVMICAMLNARFCASTKIRLMRRKTSTTVAPFGPEPSNPFKAVRNRRRRMAHYTNPRAVGTKAADYAAYGDDVEEVPEHEVCELRSRPNPYMTGHELDELSYLNLEVCGNAYDFVAGDPDGPPEELYPLRAQFVRAQPDEDSFIASYVYARDTSEPMTIDRRSVFHYRHMASPFDPYYGIGPFHAVLLEADLAQSATLSEHFRWKNGSRPDYAVETTAAVTDPNQREQLRAAIAREHRGLHKSGAPIILSQAKIVPLGFTPKDMEYVNGLKISNEAIWNAFGVPQSMLSLNDANLASATTGGSQYTRQTIMPRVAKRAEFLTEYLLPRYGVAHGEMWFAPDNPDGDEDSIEAERLVSLVSGKIMTTNEARSELGLPPAEDPRADELFGQAPPALAGSGNSDNPFGGSPFADMLAPFAKAVAEVAKVLTDGKAAIVDGVSPVRASGASQHALAEGSGSDKVDAGDGCSGPCIGPDEDRGASGVRLDFPAGLKFYGHEHAGKRHKALMPDEPAGLAKIRQEFEDELEGWFSKYVRQLVNAQGEGVMLSASDVAALSDKLDEMAREYIGRLSEFGVRSAAADLSLSFDVKPTSSLVFLESYVPRLVDAVTRDTAESVRDAVARGMSEGMTMPEITGEIQKEIPGIAKYRAERIARTESSHAYTRGQIDTWKQAGIEKKAWVLGGNPCQVCQDIAAANPDPIPMDQPFYEGDFWGTGNTPAHPNCTCTTVPIMEGGST